MERIEDLVARAQRAQDAANRAHWRLLEGKTYHPAASQRLQGQADQVWEQLRAREDYDPEQHGRQEYATEVAERRAPAGLT